MAFSESLTATWRSKDRVGITKMTDVKDIFNRKRLKRDSDLYKVKKVPYSKNDVYLLNKILKNLAKGNKLYSGNFGSSRHVAVDYGSNGNLQRVTFKMSYSYVKKVHDLYLNNYLIQSDKDEVEEKPLVFGVTDDEYEKNKVAKHFKCIISPESQNVDLELLVKKFIEQQEKVTGFKLLWKAAVHNDTNHRHVHICINGTDANGKDVRFHKEDIRSNMRRGLSKITTMLVGERSAQEIRTAKENMVTACRWTNLDEELYKVQQPINFSLLDITLQNRLEYLSNISLAAKTESGYEFKPGWKDVLTAAGRYNSFIDEFKKNAGLELYDGKGVTGTVEKVITFDKDEAWNDALIINTGNKRVYVPVRQIKKINLINSEVSVTGGSKGLGCKVSDKDITVVRYAKKKSWNR